MKKKVCCLLSVIMLSGNVFTAYANTAADFKNAGIVSIEAAGANQQTDKSESLLIVNISKGEVLSAINISDYMEAALMPRLLLADTVLEHLDIFKQMEVMYVSDEAEVDNTDLIAGTVISTESILKAYIYSGAKDYEAELLCRISGVSGSEGVLAGRQIVNADIEKMGLAGTVFLNYSDAYPDYCITNVYDLYCVISKLLLNDWFRNNLGGSNSSLEEVLPDGYSVCGSITALLDTISQISILKNNNNEGIVVISLGKAAGTTLELAKDELFMAIEAEKNIVTPEPDNIPEITPSLAPTPKATDAPTPKPTKKPSENKEDLDKLENTKVPFVTPKLTNSEKKLLNKLLKYGDIILPCESNDARYQYLFGSNSKVYTIYNKPKGYTSASESSKSMIKFNVPVWKMASNGSKYSSTYEITVNKKVAANVFMIFKEIYELDIKFPIKVLKGYGYRKVGGVGLSNSTLMSVHSFGVAIDINPGDYDNDYFLGKGNDLRDKSNPYCIPDEVIDIFAKYGWNWGGNFSICADTMHFQYLGLDFLTYQGNPPFRTLKYDEGGYMTGADVKNLQKRLNEVGIKTSCDGVYGKNTMAAIKKFQKLNGLEATGVVDYFTWEKLINMTHYMSYVF